MVWTDYGDVLAKTFIKLRGDDNGAGDVGGQSIKSRPLLTSFDPVTMLTQYSPALVRAVSVLSALPDRVPLIDELNEDGTFKNPFMYTVNGAGLDVISAAQFVAGAGRDGAGWQRWNVDPSKIYTVAVGRYDTDKLIFLRNALDDWQRAVSFAVALIRTYPHGDTIAPVLVKTWFEQILPNLGAKLDVLGENPPTTSAEVVDGAISFAKDRTEAALAGIANLSGKALAEVGNIAGNAAGAVAKGFFSQATLLTLAVAGVAVFILVH